MYRLLITLLTAGTAAAFLGSCAVREDEDTTIFEQRSLDAWMEKYVTERGVEAVRQSNGVWVEFLDDGDQTAEAGRDTVVWAQLQYTSTDIEGNVFATRDSTEALRQRTWTPQTYYSPDYVYCDEYNSYGLPAGQHFALTGDLTKPDGSTIKMGVGTRVKLYIPSFLAYGSNGFTDDQGYGGQYPLGGTRIMIQDLTLKDAVKNPLEREEMLVERFATERWGKERLDTLAPGFYVDTINFRPRADLLADFPNRPLTDEYGYANDYDITIDSMVNVWYIGRFLPTEEYPQGFIFDTNIPAVWDEFYLRRKNDDYLPESTSSGMAALSYTPTDDQENYIAAWYRAIPSLRKGQWSRVVFTSSYGYGATGMSKAVQDYQDYYNELMSYYSYSSSYGSSYGGYDSSYYDYGYGDAYSSYYGYSTSGYSDTESEQTIITEIQPYTPLIFEIYIEDEHAEDDEE